MDLSLSPFRESIKTPLFMDMSLISYHESMKRPSFMDLSPELM